ncbi:tRNA processing endoribonuclease [Xylariales sp. AK1849]|nr:tRNA processing endoribonuclease [Xylariales sp. AK1849]
MKGHHELKQLLSRSPLAKGQPGGHPKTRRATTSPSHSRNSGALPRKRRSESPNSCFDGAEIPPDLLRAPRGATLRILPVPASLRLPGRRLKPWFFIQTISNTQKPQLSLAQLQARAFSVKMLNWIQLITTPTADTPGTCLLLHFDNQRYVFGNISEGTQRAMMQRKIALNKVEDVFVSGLVNWHNAGGLLGMILTLADVIGSQKEHVKAQNADRKQKGRKEVFDTTLSKLNIHGGNNLTQLLATARRFVFRKNLPIQPHETREDPRVSSIGNEPDWKDSNIKVWYMPVESTDKPVESTRKRSHEEMSNAGEEHVDLQASNPSKEDDQKQVLEIVTQMFNSKWKVDALVETTLYEAKLPAKLFVRNEKGHIQVYNGPLPGDEGRVPNIPVLLRQPWPATSYLTLPWTEPSRQSMCYIVKNHDRRGRFNPEEAQKHGVAKSDYSKLTHGKSVTGKDGITVTPDMVLGQTVLGQGFAVLDVPDIFYIDSLLSRPELANREIMRGIEVVFWLLGSEVINDPRLQAFMQTTDSLRHIVCSGDSSPNMIALESAATQAYRLNCIDRDRFPLPDYSNNLSLSKTPATAVSDVYERGRTGKMIQFAPQFMHKDDQIIPFPDLEKLAQNAPSLSEVRKLTNEGSRKCRDPTFLAKIEKVESDIPNRDAEIITLGTGSALPSKYRNVSATLVRVPGSGNYLFDAGENTLGQLRRVFGNELPSILQNLKVIWISHLHADHHLGIAGVIRAWNAETRKSNPSATLHIASQWHMLDWLREYANIEDYGYNRLTFTSCNSFDPARGICQSWLFKPADQAAYGLERIEATSVEHCYGALATAFTWPSGLKIAYSGDCRPSDGFVKIGQGSTVLIHESTFDDELKGDAIAKKHSTMSEAIDVGRRMGARRILLTHFSQRYQKVPVLEENLEIRADAQGDEKKPKSDEVILVAFDYMRVKLGEFRKAQAFLPAIQKLFEDVGDQ